MTVINTNVKSLVAQGALAANNNKLATAMERLSTGSRINSAKDDAAGLAISTRMESQVRGLNAAIRNANDGISLVQTAEGAMEEISSMLQRMRELAIQASSDVNNSTDRANLDAEVQQLKAEIDRVVDTTRFNDKKLLDGSLQAALQIGAKSNETMQVNVNNISSLGLGTINASNINGVTEASFKGVEAQATKSRLTFQENGTYTFKLKVADSSGTPNSNIFNITATVANGSADDVVSKINQALAAALDNDSPPVSVYATIPDSIRVTSSGFNVDIENLAGGLIELTNFAVTSGGGNATWTSVAGGTTSTNVTLTPTGAGTAVAQEFDVSKTAITDKQNSSGTVTIGGASATLNDKMHLTLVANGVTTVLSTTALAAQQYNTTTALADLLTADTDYKNSGYYITQNAGTLTIEREDGADFTVDASHVTSSGASVTGAGLITMTTTGGDLNVTAPQAITGAGLYTTAQPNEIALALGGISTAVGASDQIALALTANGTTTVVNTAAGALTDIDDVIAALRLASTGNTEYKFSKNSQDQLVVKRLDGATFDMTLKSQNATSGVATTGLTATTNTGVNVVAAVTPYRVESPSAPRSMYLDFSGPDTYTFKFSNLGGTKTSTITANYTGTAANLSSIAADIQAQLNALPHPTAGKSFDFNVVVENGGLRIDEANGYSFGISDFTSVGSGTLLARAGANQLSNANKSVLTLDDTITNTTGKTTTSVGTTPTSVIMAFDALTSGATSKDTYSFTISDGVTTAVVSNVIRDGSLANAAGDQVMLAAINSALIVSGLDDLVTAGLLTTGGQGGPGVFTLTHALGRTLTIGDFSSTGNTAVRVEPTGLGVTGTPRFLDDNFSSASGGAVVRNVDVLTASNATNAIEVLDAALNDVSVERANLGAIQSRLDHTINNLTNISTNTSASRSRIMDADYGAESANLAKAQIIQQAATAMLAQANQSAQSVLSLLQ